MTRIHSADELEVCEEVGRGGFGVVFRGLIKSNNMEVAIKQIDLENDQTDLFEINKEIQIISECRLPQIIKYLGCFSKNYKLWIIMEYVNGGSLFDLLKPGAINDERVVSILIREILVALEYLHNQGKIHRDLKSQNILLNKDGEVKLTDFGVSTQVSSNFSRRNTTVGTPYWMAPEVILNSDGGHSFKADIWSLGCCAFEILTGKPPLQSSFPPMKALRQISRCTREEDFTNLIGLKKLEISSTFRDFLEKCFTLNPNKRSSATRLLKHKFITKYEKLSDNKKMLKKLITKKQLWDQENHIPKAQNFYVPTEMAKNQQKWQFDDNEVPSKSFQFDISSIVYSSSPSSSKKSDSPGSSGNLSSSSMTPPSTHGKISSSPGESNEVEESPQQYTVTNSKQDQFKKTIKPEFVRILNKIFHKVETKNNLTTQQYDSLVSLNENLINLLSFVNAANLEGQSYKKILIFQYFKYFLKELSKPLENVEPDNSRALLQRLIIPSNFSINSSQQTKNSIKEFNEIESSLFESWIDKMNERWSKN